MSDETGSEGSGAVWNRLNQQGDELNALARAIAATEANLGALAKSVETGFNNQNDVLNRLIQSSDRQREKSARPVNYAVWVGGFFGLLTLFGGYTMLFNSSNIYRLDSLELRQQMYSAELVDSAFLMGAQSEAVAGLKKSVHYQHEQVIETSKKAAHVQGAVEALQNQVNGIDNLGSRVWTKKVKP